MRYCICIAMILVLAGCHKDPMAVQIDNLEGGTIRAFGHGGMGDKYRYPMNSYESLLHVLASGAYGTEMDVQLSKDSVLVLYHDVDLNSGTSGSGKIKDKTWDELNGCHYKYPIVSPAKLITADDFFNRHGTDGYYYTFDCRSSEEELYFQAFSNKLYELIQKYKIRDHCFIESHSVAFLKRMHALDTSLMLVIVVDSYADALAAKNDVPLYGLTINRLKIRKSEIADAHDNGLRVTLYNARSQKQNRDAIDMNPDFIQSDDPEFLIHALK